MFEAVCTRQVREWPAVIGSSGALTWQALVSHVTRAAGKLESLGIKRLGICLSSDWQHLALLLACFRENVTACLISPQLPPEGVRNAMQQVDIDSIATRRTDLDVQTLDPDAFFSGPKSTAATMTDTSAWATIIYTTGSEGTPKAAVHRLENHLSSARVVAKRLGLAPGDRWLLCLPLHHVSGLSVLFRCLAAGATIVLPSPDASLVQSLYLNEVTHVSAVAHQLLQIGESTQTIRAPQCLKTMVIGGGLVPLGLLKKMTDAGWPVCTTYGLTEMSSMVTLSQPGSHLETAGQLLPGYNLKIARDNEILVRGPALFAGYLEDGLLRQPFDTAGWLRTGDIGELDNNQRLLVKGRKDNVFVSGGENISPEEIERHLSALPKVIEAIVVAVPHWEFGARPVAFVRGAVDHSDIERQLRASLPGFKIPQFRPWPQNVRARGLKPNRRYFTKLAVDPEQDAHHEAHPRAL